MMYKESGSWLKNAGENRTQQRIQLMRTFRLPSQFLMLFKQVLQDCIRTNGPLSRTLLLPPHLSEEILHARMKGASKVKGKSWQENEQDDIVILE